jgi:hypothetical protein
MFFWIQASCDWLVFRWNVLLSFPQRLGLLLLHRGTSNLQLGPNVQNVNLSLDISTGQWGNIPCIPDIGNKWSEWQASRSGCFTLQPPVLICRNFHGPRDRFGIYSEEKNSVFPRNWTSGNQPLVSEFKELLWHIFGLKFFLNIFQWAWKAVQIVIHLKDRGLLNSHAWIQVSWKYVITLALWHIQL